MASIELVNDWPPNVADIRAVLPISDRNIFTYGGKIYSPGALTLPEPLIEHEKVHIQQQGRWHKRWWRKYLRSKEFRLSQEIPAHKAEYRAYCVINADRNAQHRYLLQLSQRLAAPMYGGIISATEAMREIRQ